MPIFIKNIEYLSSFHFLQALPKNKNYKIGIMGGSFNPAHQGHLYIAEEAVKRLKLDFVIWMVTPLSPHKTNSSPLKERINHCRKVTFYNKKILVCAPEESFSNYYSYNSINIIKKLISTQHQLYWIMGDDNLKNFHKFYKWKEFISLCNIAIFSREQLSFSTLSSKAGVFLRKFSGKSKFYYFFIKKNNVSSTYIRKQTQEI